MECGEKYYKVSLYVIRQQTIIFTNSRTVHTRIKALLLSLLYLFSFYDNTTIIIVNRVFSMQINN